VSDDEAVRLLSACRIFLFCAREDFGITPVEANGYGAPVVAFGAGGVLETMRAEVTAEFFEHQDVKSVVAAVGRAVRRQWDVQLLQENARRFTPERFREGLKRVVWDTLAGRGEAGRGDGRCSP
jgi:glycosyltransferase involved in cell wall biosynthesis